MCPGTTGPLPQAVRDERRLVVAVEIGVVPHRLLNTDDVGTEPPDCVDRAVEVVVAFPIRSLVNVECGNPKGGWRVRRRGNSAAGSAGQGDDRDNQRSANSSHGSNNLSHRPRHCILNRIRLQAQIAIE